jgi:D-glycero-alpha-D-manno-heptose 1-phosphate guanylyltransferase
MIEAIVLAGGEGKRLRSVVRDLPKPMADIAGRPFLWWLMIRLSQQNVGRVVLSVGYKAEAIQEYFGNKFGALEISYSLETEPLGTGGAMRFALEAATQQQVIILNGDTYTDIDLRDFISNFQSAKTDLAVAVKYLSDVARYGSVVIEPGSNTITGFDEKRALSAGYINAGVYCLRRNIFAKYSVPDKFSFERDFLPKYLGALKPVALKGVQVFIDIGVPEDYALAQTLIPTLATQASQ